MALRVALAVPVTAVHGYTSQEAEREYARAWGYPFDRLEKLDRELDRHYSSNIKRFWRGLKRLVVGNDEA